MKKAIHGRLNGLLLQIPFQIIFQNFVGVVFIVKRRNIQKAGREICIGFFFQFSNIILIFYTLIFRDENR